MKKRYVILILLILIIILIFNKTENQNTLKDILIFNLWNDIKDPNEYILKPKEKIQIDIFNTINYEKETNREVSYKIHKKIAPGAKGKFIVKLSKSKKSNIKIYLSEKGIKPQNLTFIIGEQRYKTIKELEKEITQKLLTEGKIIINWEWQYYNNTQNDIQDTKDGESLDKYYFEIQSIIEEG